MFLTKNAISIAINQLLMAAYLLIEGIVLYVAQTAAISSSRISLRRAWATWKPNLLIFFLLKFGVLIVFDPLAISIQKSSYYYVSRGKEREREQGPPYIP